jgi:signal transduction histidine kinase
VRLLTRQLDLGEAASETPHDEEGEDDEGGENEAAEQHSGVGFVQVGFVLTLYAEQQRELAVAIVAAVLMGIAGAGLVSLLVTRRALTPIRQAFDAERRFVAAASHELRTPVAIIRASAEVMQREGHSTPAGETLVADIVAETDRLGHLVGDLLALASAEAGAVTIDARPMDLGTWLEDTTRRVAPMVRSQGLGLAMDIEPAEGAIVMADPERLTQLLLVLIDNAMAHSPTAGTITLTAARDGSRSVAVSVIDEGPGVPVAQREAIFEPFARTPGARRTEGSGLGLAIARQLAMRQGATLEAVDPPRRETGTGPGARFVLRMPLTTAQPVAPGRPLPGAMSSG